MPVDACRGAGTDCGCDACAAMRAAAAAGARPAGVPVRVYGAYLEARGALRANAAPLAIVALEWLLEHLAEERGAARGRPLPATIESLRAAGVIGPRVGPELVLRATSERDETARAWALLSIAEHALQRLYL